MNDPAISDLIEESLKKLKIDDFYKSLEVDGLKTEAFADVLFKSANDTVRSKILGPMKKDAFLLVFNNCRKGVKGHFNELAEMLMFKSFPETYFHPDIADALAANNKLTDPDQVEGRILETGKYIYNALSKNFALAYALGIGVAHSRRRALYQRQGKYNPETVEYTLLTFSYFGSKKLGVKDEDWFLYWKIFGSMMGLPPANLHNNHGEAEGKMKAIHKKCVVKPGSTGERLLDAYIQAIYESKDAYDDIKADPPMVSKRMREYLTTKGKLT